MLRLGTLALFLVVFAFSAQAVMLVNSEDWKDTYSVLLYAGLQGDHGLFVNSESLGAFTKVIPTTQQLQVFESTSSPYIRNIDNQLSSAGYTILNAQKSNSFNVDLAPADINKFIIVSEDNWRVAIALSPYAIKTKSWVYIASEETMNEILDRLEGAESVLAVGNFKREIASQIDPFVTERINNKDSFKDSKDIAQRFGEVTSVILADGTFIEPEFFTTKNPVLLTGGNKILDDTYQFLIDSGIKSVVIVGNRLSVVGEQIRTRSNKQIGVFVKFGQSGISEDGTVYALSLFELPPLTLGLTVNKVVYTPSTKQLVVFYESKGTTGLYEVSTWSVKTGDEELATESDTEVYYLGPSEQLPVIYENIQIPLEKVTDQTQVEFYTSFGAEPNGLDNFLTMTNKFGPPFSIGLTIEELNMKDVAIDITDAAYYTGLKRVGVDIANIGQNTVYYNVKVNGLIVNGLTQNLVKEDLLEPGQTKTTYLPVALDKVDLEENTQLNIVVNYGSDAQILLKSLAKSIPFNTKAGGLGLAGMLVAIGGKGSRIATIALLVIILGVGVFMYLKRRKSRTMPPKQF